MPSKKTENALAGMAQLVGVPSHNWKVVGLIPSQGTYRLG